MQQIPTERVQADEELDDADWAEHELGPVQLGNERLAARLVSLARTLARAPDASLPEALPQWGDLKAAYRFFDNAKAMPGIFWQAISMPHGHAPVKSRSCWPYKRRLALTGSIIHTRKGWGR